jgi:tetratricopeptide (TPR) repeat protein
VRLSSWTLLVLATLSSRSAPAKPIAPVGVQAPEPTFWSNVVSPHAARVSAITREAAALIDEALDPAYGGDRRTPLLDAHRRLIRARELSPDDPALLAQLGRVADELGRTREAIAILEHCIRVAGAEVAGAAVTGRLGAIYLRIGERDAAIRWLRKAQVIEPGPQAAILLANALAARGEVTAGIEVLSELLPERRIGAAGIDEGALSITFALAVIYDRDEQRGAAFQLLDALFAQQPQWIATVRNDRALARLAPVEDVHYFQALLAEANGELAAARAAWALYANSGDSPWRARALEHIAAIDRAQRRRQTSPPAAPPALPPQAVYP